jgi:hypothetical protein
MKIDVNQVPFEGIEIEGEVSSGQLDLETAVQAGLLRALREVRQ